MRIFMKGLNEEKVVKRVIGDLHDEPWVSEFVVVDGWSSDFTVNELKLFPKVTVHLHRYEPWYHDQEIMQANTLLSYAHQNEIIFLLDFDEKLDDNLKATLAEIDQSGELPEGVDLVHISRRTMEVLRHEDSPFAVLGDDGWPIESHQIGQFPDAQPRLLRRSYLMHWINSPHRTLAGYKSNHNLDPEKGMILHYEKDDYRDRISIERRWLRPQATRKELGLTPDIHETSVKPEFAEGADPNYWRDR